MAELDKVLENEQRVENNKQQAEDLYNTASNVQGGNDEWLNEMQGKLNAVKPKQQAQPTTNDAWLEEQQKKLDSVGAKTGDITTQKNLRTEGSLGAENTLGAYTNAPKTQQGAVTPPKASSGLMGTVYQEMGKKYKVGSEAEFREAMKNPENSKFVYDEMNKAGMNLGDYNKFLVDLGLRAKEWRPVASVGVTEEDMEVFRQSGKESYNKAVEASYDEINKELKAKYGPTARKTHDEKGPYVYYQKGNVEVKAYDDGNVWERDINTGHLISHSHPNGDTDVTDENGNIITLEAPHKPTAPFHGGKILPTQVVFRNLGIEYSDAEKFMLGLSAQDSEYLREELSKRNKEAGVKDQSFDSYGKMSKAECEAERKRLLARFRNAKDSVEAYDAARRATHLALEIQAKALGYKNYKEATSDPGDYDLKRYLLDDPDNAYDVSRKRAYYEEQIKENGFDSVWSELPSVVRGNVDDAVTASKNDSLYAKKNLPAENYANQCFRFKDWREEKEYMNDVAARAGALGKSMDEIIDHDYKYALDKIQEKSEKAIERQVERDTEESIKNVPKPLLFAYNISRYTISGNLVRMLNRMTGNTPREVGQALDRGLDYYAKDMGIIGKAGTGIGRIIFDMPYIVAFGGLSRSLMGGEAAMEWATNRVGSQVLTMTMLGEAGQIASDLAQGEFSGVIPHVSTILWSGISGLALGEGSELSRALMISPSNRFVMWMNQRIGGKVGNFIGGAVNKGAGHTIETLTFTIPTYAEKLYSGEGMSMNEAVCILGENAFMVAGLKSKEIGKGWTLKDNMPYIEKLREAGYNKVADAIESENFAYYNDNTKQMDIINDEVAEEFAQLTDDMAGKERGVDWETYQRVMNLSGRQITATPADRVAVVKDGKGRDVVQLLDKAGRVIIEKRPRDINKLKTKWEDEIKKTKEEQSIVTFAMSRDAKVREDALRRIANKMNEGLDPWLKNADGTYVLDEQGQKIVDPNSNGWTPERVLAHLCELADIEPEKLTAEQKQMINEYDRLIEEVDLSYRTPDEVADSIRDMFGVSTEDFNAAIDTPASKRNPQDKAVQALNAFQKIMERGSFVTDRVVGEVTLQSGEKVQVINEADLNDKNGLFFYTDEAGDVKMISASQVESFRPVADESTRLYEAWNAKDKAAGEQLEAALKDSYNALSDDALNNLISRLEKEYAKSIGHSNEGMLQIQLEAAKRTRDERGLAAEEEEMVEISDETPLSQEESNQMSSATDIDLEPPANDSAETPDVIEPEGESSPTADPLRRKKAEAFLDSFFSSMPKEDKEKLIDYYASREDLDSIISEHLEKTNDDAGKAAYDEALKRIYKYGEEEIGLETRQPETPKPENEIKPAEVETGKEGTNSGGEEKLSVKEYLRKYGRIFLNEFGEQNTGIKGEKNRTLNNRDDSLGSLRTAKRMLTMFKASKDWQDLRDRMQGNGVGATIENLTEVKTFFEKYKRGEITDQDVESLFNPSLEDEGLQPAKVETEGGDNKSQQGEEVKDATPTPEPAKDRVDELLDAMGFEGKERDEQRAFYEDKNNAEQFEQDYSDFVGAKEPQPQVPQPKEEVKTEDKKDEVVDDSQQETEIIDDLDAPMPMKKVKGKDKPDYSRTTPRKGYDYLINKSGLEKEEVLDKVDYEISKAKNKVKALEKKQPSIKDKRFDGDEDEYLQAKAEWQNELNAAKAEQEYWEEVQEIEKVQGSINEIDGAKSWTSVRDVFNKIRSRFATDAKIRNLIDSFTPQTLYDACMDYLSGGVRFIWYGDKNNKGLQQEKGWGEEERKKLIGMIASKEKGGITPQKAVHDIVDLYGQDLGLTLDQGKEIFDTLIDALDGISTRGDAADYIRRRKLEAVRDELARRLEGETNTYDTVADRYYDEQVQQYRDEHPELEGATDKEVMAAMERERNMGNEVQNENPPAKKQQSNDTIPDETGVSDDFFEGGGEDVPFSLKQEQTESKETVTSDVRARLEEKLGKDLTDRIESIAKSLGVKVRFTDEDVNGFMDHDEGVLYIGKNIDSNKTEAFVAGHELTHEMQTLSEGKGSDVYDTFKQAALEWAKEHREEGGKGYDFDWVKNKYENHFRNKYKDEALDRGMSEAEAEAYAEQRVKEKVTDDYVNDEIAANVAGRMLENPSVAEDLFKLREAETPQERRTRLQRILDWIKELISKRRIGNKKPEELTPEDQKLLDLRDKFNDMYNEVVREDLNTQGIETAKKGDARYAVKDTLEGEERERAIEDLMEVTGRSRATVTKWLNAEQSLAKVILDGDNQKFLDLQVDESVPSIWNNSDYPQGTVEFSNICRKRLPFTVIYQRLQKEFPNRVFDASTLEDIRQIMKDNGEDVACGLCFVEDRRQLLGEIGDGFINAVKGENADINENQRKALEKLRESGDGYIPNLYELLTLDGMKKLRKDHPAVAQAFVDYNNARGMQAGRLFQAYSAYHREILNWNKAKIKSVNDAGGLRIFSFSDFEAHHLIDLVQVLTDCAAKGIKVQGYTKVPEFAKAVKDTKAKINRSLIAKGKGYVDENYVPQEGEAVSPNVIDGKRLLFDTVEGIDVNHPDFFDSTGNKNVGNIVVGINDEHIRLAMLDPFVDYIIPFHSGLSEAIRAKKGIGDWENYKLTQLEKKYNESGKLVNADKHGINIYTDVLPRGEELIGKPIRNARDFQNAFFKACEEKGWVPRFSKFINKNKKGEYVYTPGYEKLLTDFKLFDKNGKLLPQEAVEPRFDNEFNKTILDKYVEGEKSKVPYDELYAKVKEGLGLNDTHYEEMAESVVEDTKASREEKEERNIRFSLVEDPEEIERLDKEPKEVGYRNVVLNEDGSLGSPMANRLGKTGVGRRATTPFEFNRWERSDENPDLANDKGKIDLIKPDGKPVNSVDYNPYIHIRPTTVNKQFKQAWERDNLVYIKTEYPASELNGGYQAEKAAKPVGKHPWGGGELILSRWDKPVEIVPWEEVANEWVKEFKDRGVEFDIVPPKLLPILMERGVEILPPHKGMGKACNDAYREKVLKTKENVQYALKEDSFGDDKEMQEAAKEYNDTLRLTERKADRKGEDFYPTPAPLALVASRILNGEGMDILDIGSGDGMLHKFIKDGNVTAIEKSPELAEQNRNNTNANVIEGDFLEMNDGKKYPRIILNPPYGNKGAGAFKHLDKAYEALDDNGRMVAILPMGKNADKLYNDFVSKVEADGNRVTANVELPSCTFYKAGIHGSRTRLVVVDKGVTGETQNVDLSGIKTNQGLYETIHKMGVDADGKVKGIDLDQVEDTNKNATSSERSGAVSGNSSTEGLPQGGSAHLSHGPLTTQAPLDAAKIQKNTETTLRAVKKIQNEGGLKGDLDTEAQAVSVLGKRLHLDKSSSSQSNYGDFYEEYYEGAFDVDGRTVRVRISTHPANGTRIGNAPTDDKISIVIHKDGEHKDKGPHNGFTEFLYEPNEISPADAANAIVKGVENLIVNGEYVDVTGKAHSQEYPYIKDGKKIYSLREEGTRDFAAEMRELMRRRLRGEDITAELEQLRADRRAAEAARSAESAPATSTGGAGNGEPPIEPPTPPAPPTPEPAPELPPTGYERPMSPIEMAKAAAIKAVADTKASLEQRNAARRELTASLRNIHKAMGIQKEYDRATVENVVSLCKMMVQSGLIDRSYVSNLTPLFTKLKDVNGMTPQGVTSVVNDIMDVMLKSQERSVRNEIAKLLNTKGTKVDQNGVVTQAGLDIRGQHTMKELSEYMGKGSVIIDNHIAKLEEERSRIPDGHQERIDDIDDKILGSQLAKQFSEIEETHSVNISEAEQDLDFLKERYKAGEIGIKEYTEQKHALENLIRSYRMAQTDALWNQANAMRHVIAGSKEGTRNWIEQQKQRKEDIRHDANSDMEGLSKQTQGDPTAKQRIMNMGIPRFLSSSLYTLQTMLKSLGGKHAMGEGYLYNRFFRGWMKNRDAEITEYRNDMNLLNKKAKEITGFKYFGLYDMIMMLPKMRVEYMDGGEMVPHELDQGQLGYAYMVNKMEDGAAALRNMGITEEKMQEISNFLNPNLKKFYDWLQDDFLAGKWEGMNEVHRRMFGADMDRVANYIPLHRDREAGTQKVDISQSGEPPLQSTVVGSIIQRVHSNLGIDLKHNNAIDVVAKHLLEATHWKHFSEWKRDANTLLSDTSFRNKVKNSDTIYGSGDQLWSRLNDVFKIAGGDYSTPADRKFKVNESVINMARAVNAAKVSMRVFTATKQLLSLPVFATECNTATLIKNLGFLLSPDKTSGSPTQNSFVWCLQNLPQFRERVMSRTSGETRLENGDLGWGFSRQRVFENAARIGLAPNAFIDACTVAAGAKSIYEKRFAQYKKNGYSEKVADEKAKIDAETAFNESQQSSEKAFVSPIQVDRDAVSLGLSTFRNASMGYERKFVDAVRNFKHLTMGGKEYRDTLVKRKEKELIEQGMDKAEARAAAEKEYKWVPGAKAYREVTMEFMKKQMMRDGLTETQAKAAAERLYRRALWRSTLNFLMFGFGAQMAWNVGGKLPYLIFGDNDEEKKRILKQAAVHAGIGGWVEGLPTGDMLSEGMTNWAMNLIDNGNPLEGASFFEFDPDLLTLTSDVVKVTKALEGPNPLKGATTFVNLLGQILTGVNPETFTDAGVAIYDACNGDPETSNEALMCVLRIMQCPQSQLDQMYIDELRMSAREAQGLTPEEVARRYAYYKAHKDTPYMWWIYNQGKKDEIVKKYEENFNKKLNEDVKEDGGTAEDYHDLMESATTKKEHDKYKNKEIAELSARGPEALMKAWDAEHAKGADADYKYMRSLMSRYQKDVYGEGKMPTAEDEAANYKEEHGEDLSEQAEKIGRDLGFEAQDSYYQMSQFKTQNAPSKNRVMKAWGETGASFRYTEDGEFFDMDEYKVKLPVEDKAKRARAMKLVEENKDEMKRIYRNAWRMKKISALYKTADELKKKWEIKLMFIPTPTIDLKDAKAISDAYKEVQQLLNDEATDREMDRKAKKKGSLKQ